MKKDEDQVAPIALLPKEVMIMILAYCEDSPRTLGRVAAVCTFWNQLTQPKLENLKPIIFAYLSENVDLLEIVITDQFQQALRFAVKIDSVRAYPLVQQAFALCVKEADLSIQQGFGDLHPKVRTNLHVMISEKYSFVSVFNRVFWDLIHNDNNFNGLLGCMSIFEALKILVQQDQLQILPLINSYHPDCVEEDAAFRFENGVLYCGNRTVDSWIQELMEELTRNVQPGHRFRYKPCRIRQMARRQALELLEYFELNVPNSYCCFQ